MKNKIVYDGRTFDATDIKSGQIHLAASLPSMKLEPNTFTAVVKSEDSTLTEFTRNTPLYYYYRERLVCISYVQTVDRIGPDRYKFYGTSAIGRLIEQPHAGGIYTGQTAEEVIADICGPVPFEIKSALKKIKLYGWLPYASPSKSSARDNLVQVLFAIGASVKTDLNGVLKIEGLWDGISGTVGRDKMYAGASTDYEGKVTQVIVTEHQYVQWTEEKQLFEGTAQAGDIITFDEPMHSLTAEGFTIQASGANWARVSAGSGVLKGLTYLHNTRQVSVEVQQAATPNIKTIESATLVSLLNSSAVATRMAKYYKCRERVDTDALYGGETPGDRIATYHPFDKTGIFSCLESADITISNTLKAHEKLLVGYIPPQIENTEYFDHTEVITENMDWDPPEGVTVVNVVCIGGGFGGDSGYAGEACYTPSMSGYQIPPGIGGDGGKGGSPGSGGRVTIGTINVAHGQKVPARIGAGGKGGAVSSNRFNPGSEGGATTFGTVSSSSGTVSATGYTDLITGKTYALPGTKKGIDGGKGSGSVGEGQQGYEYGNDVTDERGRVWKAGNITNGWENETVDVPNFSGYGAQAGKGCGGGAAAGANGKDGSKGSVSGTTVNNTKAIGGKSGDGGDAIKAESASTQGGFGGNGGHGGGGEGGTGLAFAYKTKNCAVQHGRPGYGGAGGDGSRGIIILHYRKPKKAPAGQLVDKNNRMVLDRLGRRIIM